MSTTSTDGYIASKNMKLLKEEKPTSEPVGRKRGRPAKGSHVPKYEERLQIKLTSEGREQIDKLVKRVGFDGIAPLIRDAVRLYDIVTDQLLENDNDFLVRDNKTGEIKKISFWSRPGNQ